MHASSIGTLGGSGRRFSRRLSHGSGLVARLDGLVVPSDLKRFLEEKRCLEGHGWPLA